jgi:hypothetical protein
MYSCFAYRHMHSLRTHTWACMHRKPGHEISVLRLDWNDFVAARGEESAGAGKAAAYDYIVGSDLLYDVSS